MQVNLKTASIDQGLERLDGVVSQNNDFVNGSLVLGVSNELININVETLSIIDAGQNINTGLEGLGGFADNGNVLEGLDNFRSIVEDLEVVLFIVVVSDGLEVIDQRLSVDNATLEIGEGDGGDV